MKAYVQAFRAGIEDLLAFLTNTEHEAELVQHLRRPARFGVLESQEQQLLAKITAARTDRKRYVYAVAIISVYGLLERFVEALIEAFVERIAQLVDSYDKLPDAIRKAHLQLSLDLTKALIEERHRQGTTPAEVISNLHSCLSGGVPFQLNGAAFVLHRGNISLQRITGFLASLGIEGHLRRVTLTRDFSQFYESKEPERKLRDVADQDLAALLEPIDGLLQRRNYVAHGVIDDIESVDLLKERCRFVEAYGVALYDVFAQEALRYEITRPGTKALGRPIVVYNRKIVCFEAAKCNIAVGSVLVAATGNSMEPFRHGPISSLEVEGVSHQEIKIAEPTKFGVAVPYRASNEYEYFLLPSETV